MTLSILFGACAWAQRFGFRTYGASDGLKNLNIAVLLEDHAGEVWIGTESGIFVMNAQHAAKQEAFTDAGLEYIRALGEDAAGRIWAMDSRHLAYRDGEGVHVIQGLDWKNLGMEGVALLTQMGEPNAIYLLREGQLLRVASSDNGRSWKVLPALPSELRQRYPELNSLTSVVSAGGSVLWAGCLNKLCRIDLSGGTVATFGSREGVPRQAWRRLLFTREGALWARGEKNVVLLPRQATHVQRREALPRSASLGVQSPEIVEDHDGRVVLNLADGIARSSGPGWQLLDRHNGLPAGQYDTMLVDRWGELWLAPQGHGLARWKGYGVWEGWTQEEGLGSNVVWGMARVPRGDVRVVTEAGIDRVRAYDPHPSPQPHSLPLSRLRVVAADAREHLWTGDASGRVIEIDTKTGRSRIAASDLGRVTGLLIDHAQRIWVCSRAGLRYFSPEDGWRSPRRFEDAGAPKGYAWTIAADSTGTLWVTNGQGLFRFAEETWTEIHLPFPGGTEYNFLLAPAPDGTLWVQSNPPFPVLRLKVNGHDAAIIDRVPATAFGSDNITFMQTDPRGWLWVGSDDGVHVFNGSRWVLCNSDDGLLWDDTDFQGFLADPDGTIWIGTSGGLSHVLRPQTLFSLPPPELRLDTMRVGDTEVKGDAAVFDLRRPALAVHLLDTNYAHGGAIVYRYRLEGQENDWQSGSTPDLRFPALNAGRYRLEVLAYDPRLHQSSMPVSFSFKVLDPWWRRAWFEALLAGMALLLGFLFWRFSVHLLVSRQQMLERLVASRTRELELEKAELLNARFALIEMTRRDTLTGLYNRAAIFEKMGALCEAALDTGRPLAIAMADLDSFKRINDRYGHVMGDTVLRECANRLDRVIRPEDAVGRYGGEELLILMPGLTPASAHARMEQLRSAVAATPIEQEDVSLTVTCSFGVAWTTGEPCSLESLINLADTALYAAKQKGRNRVEFAVAPVHTLQHRRFSTSLEEGLASTGTVRKVT